MLNTSTPLFSQILTSRSHSALSHLKRFIGAIPIFVSPNRSIVLTSKSLSHHLSHHVFCFCTFPSPSISSPPYTDQCQSTVPFETVYSSSVSPSLNHTAYPCSRISLRRTSYPFFYTSTNASIPYLAVLYPSVKYPYKSLPSLDRPLRALCSQETRPVHMAHHPLLHPISWHPHAFHGYHSHCG